MTWLRCELYITVHFEASGLSLHCIYNCNKMHVYKVFLTTPYANPSNSMWIHSVWSLT